MTKVSPLTKVLTHIFTNTDKEMIDRDWRAYREAIGFAFTQHVAKHFKIPFGALDVDLQDNPNDYGVWTEIKAMPDGVATMRPFIFGCRFEVFLTRTRDGNWGQVRNVRLEFSAWFGDDLLASEYVYIHDTSEFDDYVIGILDQVNFSHPLFKAWREE